MPTSVTRPSPSDLVAWARGAAIISAGLGVAVLAGSVSNIDLLLTPWPGRPPLTRQGAFGFLLLGAALWLILPPATNPANRIRYAVGRWVSLLTVLSGAVKLVGCIAGSNFGSDVHLLRLPLAVLGPGPGGIAFPTAANTLLLGFGLLLVDVEIRALWIAEVMSVVAMQIALLGIVGHIFGVPELYGSLDFTAGSGMAVHSAAGFLIVGAGLLFARADRGLMALLRSRTPGGTLARRYLFMPALLLLALGFIYLTLQHSLGLGRAVASWALFMTSLTLLTTAVWMTAEALHETGLQREAAHRLLEQRVNERTAELNQANAALNATKEELARANHALESTVQERTLHLQETIRSLETVCYNIAHDLRAPNRAIAGFAQVLLAQHANALDPAAVDCLRRIARAAQKSDQLTLDLLAYGRLGHADLPCSRHSLKTVVQAASEKMSEEIAAAGGQLNIVDPLPEVWANAAVLEQIIANLLSNAFKFVAPGVLPRVGVSAEEAGTAYRLLVQDNGIGVPPEYQQKIFGVFQRLHSPDKYPGTGIGLAIVHKSVERMGGKAGVRSSPGQGSCFWIELPKPKESM